MALRDEASLAALTEDVVQTSAIEGETLNLASVRSSLARRLGVDIGALAPVDRHVEGVVDMVLNATSGAAAPPPAKRLSAEMARFLAWVNDAKPKEPALLLRAGLGHLWFVTLHPFDDGNGRIARAIGDLLLARADGSPQRFYSLSAQTQRERKAYYDILERTQKSGMDVTAWLAWFLATLLKAVQQAHGTLDQVLAKAQFWRQAATIPMNERQIKVLNRLLDGFEGKLTTRKWAAIAKCSQDTALRDITELLQHQVLQKAKAGGRSTHYEIRHRGPGGM